MKIKKILLLGLVAASLLASCKKNNDNNTAAGLGFKAITENNNGDSRTYLDGVDVKWMEGDSIMVANASGEQQVFKLAGGASTMNGNFYDANVAEAFYTPDYVALYPAKNAAGVANTIDANGIATFDLPSTQAITATGTFANKSMPMVAHSGTETLPFKNVLGGLVIPLVGDGLHVSKVVLTSLETTDKLWGVYTADCNSDDPVPTYVSGGNHQLTLSCDVPLDPVTANDFIFMVPPGTLSKGFKVEVYDGTDFLYEKTADWSATPNETFIPRSVLMKVDHNLEVVPPAPVDLVVTTISPTFISTNSAYGKGTVSGGTPSQCGLCWKLGTGRPENDVPVVTIDNDYTITATAGESFAITFTEGLVKDNVYWVRAWAKNAAGQVFYGDPIPFATRKDYANDYGGRMPYLFSVSSTKKVYFSMGNLQWSATNGGTTPTTHMTSNGTAPGTWRFAEYQFEYVGDATRGNVFLNGEHPDASSNGMKCNNIEKSEDYNGWIDLFCWGTSGWQSNSYQTRYQPWMQDGTYWDQTVYQGYGPVTKSGSSYRTYDLTGTYAKSDWGVFNAISNGGNQPNQWRVLKGPSWNGGTLEDGENQYLFRYRTATYARWARIQMTVRNDQYVHGNILFPDTYELPWEFSYTQPSGIIKDVNYMYHTEATMINEAEWSLLEYHGAVLWPAAGILKNASGGTMTLQIVSGVSDGIEYFTSSRYVSENTGNDIVPNGARGSYTCNYNPGSVPWFHGARLRNHGNSVRLVQDAN